MEHMRHSELNIEFDVLSPEDAERFPELRELLNTLIKMAAELRFRLDCREHGWRWPGFPKISDDYLPESERAHILFERRCKSHGAWLERYGVDD